MIQGTVRQLKVFLCHASGDKPQVRELYKRLVFEGVDAWLDREKLLPGQDWRLEIPKAVHEADVVLIFLSRKSITKEGYIQKEIKFALDIADEKPEGTIFLIPARLEDCTVPERLGRWHWVDLFDEEGFIKLMRSLKLRADATGSVIEPAFYEDTDNEREQRIKRIYTDGLAAYYTEDWDKACHCFQVILSEQPNHKNAAEKLEAAQQQRALANLYARALEAVKGENWQPAIQNLEELSQTSINYKDAAQLLKNARRQERLKELYVEAKALHEAQKWEAVVRIFDQISGIDPDHEDTDGLLSSAKGKLTELQQLAELNDFYSRAVGEMDAGRWDEARQLLEKVHKYQTGFLETEKLLKKVEEEIAREDEKRKQNDQINTFYEQAHGLIRSKNWRKALDKMEEIRKLDEHFPDVDGIAEKAQKELAREEQEAERQNKLAALYAEAVKLLKEEKYQEALGKWEEVRAVDPKYPDRQGVQRTAKKRLAEMTKPVKAKPRPVIKKSFWVGLVAFALIALGVVGLVKLGVTGGSDDPTLYDDFDAAGDALDGNRWDLGGINPAIKMTRQNGILVVQTNGYGEGAGLMASKFQNRPISKPFFIEASFKLDPNQNGGAGIHLWAAGNKSGTICQIWRNGSQAVICQFLGDKYTEIGIKDITSGTWHSARIEVDPSTMTFTYYIDGSKIGTYTPSVADELKNAAFTPSLWSGCDGDGCTDKTPRTVTGYFDNVRMGAIEDDPATK